jgi:hypothetical protein
MMIEREFKVGFFPSLKRYVLFHGRIFVDVVIEMDFHVSRGSFIDPYDYCHHTTGSKTCSDHLPSRACLPP